MAYRNKAYIAFDGDNDIHYYYLMKAWKHNQRDFFSDFNFYDAHEINYARDSSQEESIKRQLKTRLESSKIFVLLIGQSTKYLYKFVLWEVEQAITLNIPIIAVNLNGKRTIDYNLCPSILVSRLAVHISFNQKIIEYALGNWEQDYTNYKRNSINSPQRYLDTIYYRLGI
jgi:hypothetical protein